jgi:acyl carrier protein
MAVPVNVEDEVKKIIANIIEMDPKEIDAEASLVEDLGMDSMMALEILAALEKRFKIKIAEEDLPKITSVNRAIALAKQYVK